MTPAERLEASIRNPRWPGRPALMPYLTAGFPSLDGFPELVRQVAALSDAIEIGVPFTDPMADGVTIQDSSRIALENGTTLSWILSTLAAMDPKPEVPLMLMSYLNPLMAYGFERLMTDAVEAGVCGLIIPDLPYEECEPIRTLAEAAGLGLIQLVTPVTPPERLKMLGQASRGFVYTVTMMGVTGGQELPSTVVEYLDQVKAASRAPVCAGFGIREQGQVEALTGHADGVIVGSALIRVLAEGGDHQGFLRGLVGE